LQSQISRANYRKATEPGGDEKVLLGVKDRIAAELVVQTIHRDIKAKLQLQA
jgi:hypothetical protein